MTKRPLRVLVLLAGVAGAARAQVAPPALVEEDLQPEEAKPPPAPPEPAPVPPPSPPRAPEPPRPRTIEPVRARWADAMDAWTVRRKALREQDAAAAGAAARRLLAVKKELAIDNLAAFAASEVREARRALSAGAPAEADEHAALAVALAPDLADPWLTLARTRLARDPWPPGPVLSPLATAAGAALREPHTARALLADVLGAAIAAVAAAGALTVLVLLLRRLRVFLHDFGHLPVVRGGTSLQAFFLALVFLALPLALGLGPWMALFGAALASWLYLSHVERGVVTAALVGLALLPLAAGGAARVTAWSGSLAEEVFEIEHGADGGERVAALAAREPLPAPALEALGRWHKRRGDLAEAQRWYGRAEEVGGKTPGLLVNVGNVRFLQGDPEGAKSAWLDAVERPGADPTTLAAAYYNLAKLYLRQSALEQAQQARRRAQQLDEALIARHGADDDFRANRWLLDVPVSYARIRPLAVADGTPRQAEEAVRARLAAGVPPRLWPWVPVLLAAALWLAVLVARRIRPSSACDRCGRPACARCDTTAGPLCGQCVNVFVKKGVVEARDRLRKERQVRRHEAVQRWTARLLALASGGGGHLWHGAAATGFLVLLGLGFVAFVVAFWGGLAPPPHPSPYLFWAKIATAGPAGLVLYGLAVRDAFEKTRD